ncbi:MAG: carboxypeptidase-like regulatory domain-containing protein [Acidobacteriaceae bacterium]
MQVPLVRFNHQSIQKTGFVLVSLLALIAVCLLPPLAMAQFRASIQGVVTDPSGAVVSGATVTLIDTATNHTITATTSGSGVYTFNALPPDQFTLTVEAPGFKKKTLNNVQILPEQANAVNVTLNLGQTTQTVTVSGAQAAALDSETATLSGTIDSNQIQHLPSFDRDVFQLAQLAPGAFGDASQGSGGGTYNLPGNQGPGGSGTSGGIFATENGPQIQTRGGQYETKRHNRRWHQHRERGLGRHVSHHPERRFGPGCHHRYQQL